MRDTLKQRQEAGAVLEHQMIAFLMQFDPARELKVCDVRLIASHARSLAFDCFSKVDGQ